eukprot:CAMPEP_0114424522 /NCGR_PEP_ID=MMETSP0103-20121206/6740_1 /TAXON_ID=37642 ORGANISM="Paraphysomonas imperforata, Strain PA2" /NCGR_SAMPLE_ID=MMETSP0103 /ASSEMBLY_ACC=CAM_ASM_000201 /LENGTH=533 /DNA_ID=CAMNT_0001593283 /DNA_START=129 /DNA_END=1730 /DNA_ORIENTATION=+
MERNSLQEKLRNSVDSLPAPDNFTTYKARWGMLAMFCLLSLTNAMLWITFAPVSDDELSLTNAMLWITFAPVSDDANDYFDGMGTTYINLLAIVFQILYGPGALLGVLGMQRYGLRGTLLIGGFLSFLGAFIRVLGVVFKQYTSNAVAYSLVLLGQCVAAIAQPMFNSLPVPLASHWFSVAERDIATAVSSLFSPLGNAFGQIFPPMFISEDDETGHVSGMRDLMLLEAAICLASFLLALVFFKSHPPTPASYSSQLKAEGVNVYASTDSEDPSSRDSTGLEKVKKQVRELMSNKTTGLEKVKKQVRELMSNKDYVILLVAFSTGLGLFNTFLTLIYQIVEPYDYSNDDAGSFGAILIVFGLIGAALAGALLETTHAYRTILKGGFLLCQVAMLFFFSMLFSDNFLGLLAAFALLGLFMLPMLPAVVENCAECTYPIPEELSTGILFVGGNIVGIPFIFIVQYLLSGSDGPGPPPFRSSNFFIEAVMLFTVIVLMFYNGEYKRLQCDKLPAEERESGLFRDEDRKLVESSEGA